MHHEVSKWIKLMNLALMEKSSPEQSAPILKYIESQDAWEPAIGTKEQRALLGHQRLLLG